MVDFDPAKEAITYRSTAFRSRAGSISMFSPSSRMIGSTTANLDIAHTELSTVLRIVWSSQFAMNAIARSASDAPMPRK
jgi:hypothetical protein